MRQFLRFLPILLQRGAGQPDALVKPDAFLDPVLMPHPPAPVRLRVARMSRPCGLRHGAVDGFHRLIGFDEKLQLHLLKLPRPESVIAGGDLVAECLADLRDPEGHFLPGRFEHVFELNKNGLRGFRAQVGDVVVGFDGADGGFEHEIERPDGGFFAVAFAHHFARFLRAGNFVGLIRAKPAFARFAINHGIAERGHVPAGLPNLRRHDDRGLQADHVVAPPGHPMPPMRFDVLLEFRAQGTVIPKPVDPAVDFRRRVNETLAFAQGHDFFHPFAGFSVSHRTGSVREQTAGVKKRAGFRRGGREEVRPSGW